MIKRKGIGWMPEINGSKTAAVLMLALCFSVIGFCGLVVYHGFFPAIRTIMEVMQ